MKKLLLSTALFLGLATGAHAQIPVTDLGNLLAQGKNLAQELKSWGTQLQQLQTEIQSYQQWVYMGEQLIHAPNIATFMQLANQLGISTSLPLNPSAVQGLIAGAGGIRGVNGLMAAIPQLGNLVNTSYAHNQLYNCQTTDAGCQLAQVSSASTAGANGVAAKLLNDISSHLGIMQSLRDRASTATDPKTVQDLTLQAGIEQNWLQGTQGQLQAIGIMQSAQQAALGQAAAQKFQLDAAAFIAAAKGVQ